MRKFPFYRTFLNIGILYFIFYYKSIFKFINNNKILNVCYIFLKFIYVYSFANLKYFQICLMYTHFHSSRGNVVTIIYLFHCPCNTNLLCALFSYKEIVMAAFLNGRVAKPLKKGLLLPRK